MDQKVRTWISEVLREHPGPVSIALRQRAKFEGWLKFSLAAHAEKMGAQDVRVEADTSTQGSRKSRSDISFTWDGRRYDLELKTPNSNWRMQGVAQTTRPITKNVASIIVDAQKASASGSALLVAFVLFPVPRGDRRWLVYLTRIGEILGRELSPEVSTSQIEVPVSRDLSADVVICCFKAAPAPMGVAPPLDQLA